MRSRETRLLHYIRTISTTVVLPAHNRFYLGSNPRWSTINFINAVDRGRCIGAYGG